MKVVRQTSTGSCSVWYERSRSVKAATSTPCKAIGRPSVNRKSYIRERRRSPAEPPTEKIITHGRHTHTYTRTGAETDSRRHDRKYGCCKPSCRFRKSSFMRDRLDYRTEKKRVQTPSTTGGGSKNWATKKLSKVLNRGKACRRD